MYVCMYLPQSINFQISQYGAVLNQAVCHRSNYNCNFYFFFFLKRNFVLSTIIIIVDLFTLLILYIYI